MEPTYIIGRGVISPAGLTLKDLWHALNRGVPRLVQEPMLGPCGKLPLTAEPALEAAREDKKYLRSADRAVLLGILAARDATMEAKSHGLAVDLTRCAVIVGSSRGATETIEREHDRFLESQKVSGTTSPASTTGAFSAAISQDLGLGGLSVAISSACTTGINALGIASALLNNHQADIALAGGAESSLTPFTIAQLRAAGVLAKNPSALYPCRPLHALRTGLVPGEGSACLMLSRNPKGAMAKLSGFGAASESATPTGISPDGAALQRAMLNALEASGLKAKDIDLIVGHGASTKQGDAAELQAYRNLFGASLPAITFHKWLTGHMIGASAAVSVALATMHLATGEVPALPYWDQDMPIGGKDMVHLKRANHVLITAMGFGGSASAIIASKI